NLGIDIAIVASGLLIIGPLDTMYTTGSTFVAQQSTDLVRQGLDPRSAVSVSSSYAVTMADEVMTQMKPSATSFEGYGGYLKEEKDMTYIIINKYQLMKLKRLINEVDNEAFVVVHDVRDVFGGSFSWISTKG